MERDANIPSAKVRKRFFETFSHQTKGTPYNKEEIPFRARIDRTNTGIWKKTARSWLRTRENNLELRHEWDSDTFPGLVKCPDPHSLQSSKASTGIATKHMHTATWIASV